MVKIRISESDIRRQLKRGGFKSKNIEGKKVYDVSKRMRLIVGKGTFDIQKDDEYIVGLGKEKWPKAKRKKLGF